MSEQELQAERESLAKVLYRVYNPGMSPLSGPEHPDWVHYVGDAERVLAAGYRLDPTRVPITKIPGGHAFKAVGGVIDNFAADGDDHNGPMCAVCDEYFCEHCTPDVYEQNCPVASDAAG